MRPVHRFFSIFSTHAGKRIKLPLSAIVLSAVSGIATPTAAAWEDTCKARIGDKEVVLFLPTMGPEHDELSNNISLRENWFSGWGDGCPAYVVLKHLTPELTAAERAPFCLSYDQEAEAYLGFERGERDAFGLCEKPSRTMCERVNAGKEAMLAVSGLAAGASTGATTAAGAAGVSAVTHSSGAIILTGSSGYIAGTLGTAAASALGILTAPATIAGTAIGLVAVGGAVYVCQE